MYIGTLRKTGQALLFIILNCFIEVLWGWAPPPWLEGVLGACLGFARGGKRWPLGCCLFGSLGCGRQIEVKFKSPKNQIGFVPWKIPFSQSFFYLVWPYGRWDCCTPFCGAYSIKPKEKELCFKNLFEKHALDGNCLLVEGHASVGLK